MVTEIHIDNYKCLTDFPIEPEDFQLWLGDNGSGKSSILSALGGIQRLLHGDLIDDVFQVNSLTAWGNRDDQSFKIGMDIEGDKYEYLLILEYSRNLRKVRIKKEQLRWNKSVFFFFDGKDAHLFRINADTGKVEEGASFPADWSRSVIRTIAERTDNRPLIKFRESLDRWLIINPIPYAINQLSEKDNTSLSFHAENFAEWCSYLFQEEPAIGHKATKLLSMVLPGFEEVSLEKSGNVRRLMATFRVEKKDLKFEFKELSEGQRQLIVLYMLLEALRSGIYDSIFIDEPDNFVSLREIQPWINNMRDACEEEGRQSVIISHHPEIINTMGRGEELLFWRNEKGEVCKKKIPDYSDLLPAEIIARGWENE